MSRFCLLDERLVCHAGSIDQLLSERLMNRKKVRNVHDLYGRHLLSRIPELARLCFEQTLPPPLLQAVKWATLTEASQTLIDLGIKAEFLPDVVYHVEVVIAPDTRTQAYLLIELKSHPDKQASVQVVGYTVRISEKTLSPVYPMLLYTGDTVWNIYSYWQVIAGDCAAALPPAVTHRIDSLQLRDIADRELLRLPYGIFLYVTKHIRAMHDDQILQTMLGGCHALLAEGKDLEVIWLTEYTIEVDGNGVCAERLYEIEARYFPHVAKENRVMPKLAVSTEVAEQRGLKQGLEQGLEQGREQVVLAMLRAGMSEDEVCKIAGLDRDSLDRVKRKL